MEDCELFGSPLFYSCLSLGFRLNRIMSAYTDDSIFSIDLAGAVRPINPRKNIHSPYFRCYGSHHSSRKCMTLGGPSHPILIAKMTKWFCNTALLDTMRMRATFYI